jgi:DNA-binding NarL/FixJ family response regulator
MGRLFINKVTPMESPPNGQITVLIADPEPVSRYGLACLIGGNPLFTLAGESGELSKVRELCAARRPAVLIFDPIVEEGLHFIKSVRQQSPETKAVIFTAMGDANSVHRAFQAGACAYVTRRDAIPSLLRAIRDAAAGRRHIAPAAEQSILEKLAGTDGSLEQVTEETLSLREIQIFRLLGEGRRTKETADLLHISVKTVETHYGRIKRKLGLKCGIKLRQRAASFFAQSNHGGTHLFNSLPN